MAFASNPYAGIGIGVVLAAIVLLLTTENPAVIPLRRILPRASFGLILFTLLWFGLCSGVYASIVEPLVRAAHGGVSLQWLLAFTIGVLLPQIRLQDVLVQRSWFQSSPLRILPVTIVRCTETTRLYLIKVINREERKIADDLLNAGEATRYAIDRVFEECIESIIDRNARRFVETADQARALRLVNLNRSHRPIKTKFLLRHLGCVKCLSNVEAVRREPSMTFGSWPIDVGDRRGKVRRKVTSSILSERRGATSGRRRLDASALRDALASRWSIIP